MTVEESARPAAAGIKAVGQAIRPHCRSLAWVLLTICMAAAAHRLPAAARPEHPPADLGGGQAVLTAGMLSDTAAALNRQVQADPGLRGRIAVVDTSRGGLDAVRRDTLLLAYRTAGSRIAAGRVNPDDIRDLAGHLGYAGASATSGTPDSGGYFCFAVPPAPGVTAAWMDLVTSRATGVPGLRLAGHTTARVTVRLAAAHELGHCLAGLEPKFKDDDLASRLWNETLADTFAALWHLANGGTAADLQRFASLRDLRLGYAPSSAAANPGAYSVSHDTSRALRAIAGDAGRLLHDGLKKHGLRRLAALARGYTAATFPPPGQVRAEADAFRVVKAQVQDPGSVPGGRISPSARASLQRFDAAYRHLTGAPGSPVSPLLRVLAASDQGLAPTDALAH